MAMCVLGSYRKEESMKADISKVEQALLECKCHHISTTVSSSLEFHVAQYLMRQKNEI